MKTEASPIRLTLGEAARRRRRIVVVFVAVVVVVVSGGGGGGRGGGRDRLMHLPTVNELPSDAEVQTMISAGVEAKAAKLRRHATTTPSVC